MHNKIRCKLATWLHIENVLTILVRTNCEVSTLQEKRTNPSFVEGFRASLSGYYYIYIIISTVFDRPHCVRQSILPAEAHQLVNEWLTDNDEMTTVELLQKLRGRNYNVQGEVWLPSRRSLRSLCRIQDKCCLPTERACMV